MVWVYAQLAALEDEHSSASHERSHTGWEACLVHQEPRSFRGIGFPDRKGCSQLGRAHSFQEIVCISNIMYTYTVYIYIIVM